MPGPLRVPLGPDGVRERRRALSGPLRPQPSSGNLCPLRKGRKNRSARRGEEPQAEARPRRGQRPPPRVRPRPLGPRRARGALGAAATHAPPATKRRGARARRPCGRGAGGGGPCGGLSRERAARRLGAEGPPGAEGHRGTLGHLSSRTVWEREASAASGGESRRWRDLPEVELPPPRPGCRGRRARERGLVLLAEGHGVAAEGFGPCSWTRAAVGAGVGHQTPWDFLALAEAHVWPLPLLAEGSVRGSRSFLALSQLSDFLLPLALGRWMWSSLRRRGQRGLGASVPPPRPELAPSWCCPCPRFHRPAFPLEHLLYARLRFARLAEATVSPGGAGFSPRGFCLSLVAELAHETKCVSQAVQPSVAMELEKWKRSSQVKLSALEN
ncbi:PREDICTED: uncharacterized protein LOC105585862 [Cercocebus atys]|uniref:uncharacterized protein LOC105585862 n=1 Tax=Cercocebus atys TaxID=9531 RepID=UPI0005F430F3|nr:PREDICTED: uncharacterized protein LOC105585862 [Cercocebus atys]